MLKPISALIFCLFFFPIQLAFGQSLIKSPQGIAKVKACLDAAYNFQFDKAREYQAEVKKLFPNHPINPMLKGVEMFWSNFPVQYQAKAHLNYATYINQSFDLANKETKDPFLATENTFFKLLSKMMLAKFYADNKEVMASVLAAKDCYAFVKEGMALKQAYPEFLFPSGLYNFYRENYPKRHAAYRPFMVFFMDGDIALGLKELERASNESIFCKSDANLFLAHILLHYEGQPKRALEILQKMVSQYPKNTFYSVLYCEALLKNNQPEKVAFYADKIEDNTSSYFQSVGLFFNTWAKELLNGNPTQCLKDYKIALKGMENYQKMTKGYRGLCYMGMARCAKKLQQPQLSKSYYQSAEKLGQVEEEPIESK